MMAPADDFTDFPCVQSVEIPLAIEAAELRKDIVTALYASGGGHYGGSLSVLDILLTLYRCHLRISPHQPKHPKRDRLILSKGHAAIALYAVLRRLLFLTEPLSSFGQMNSILAGHPDMNELPGIDFSTGSLGQGLSVGLGMAFALKETTQRTWVILGDGECQEGQVWETAMLAARYNIDHLHVVIDENRYQEYDWSDSSETGKPVDNLPLKWTAFGWRVFEVDGHDHKALTETFKGAESILGQPSVIIAKTVKGKGYALIEQNPARFHCTTVSAQEQDELLRYPT